MRAYATGGGLWYLFTVYPGTPTTPFNSVMEAYRRSHWGKVADCAPDSWEQ